MVQLWNLGVFRIPGSCRFRVYSWKSAIYPDHRYDPMTYKASFNFASFSADLACSSAVGLSCLSALDQVSFIRGWYCGSSLFKVFQYDSTIMISQLIEGPTPGSGLDGFLQSTYLPGNLAFIPMFSGVELTRSCSSEDHLQNFVHPLLHLLV
jgi:hypothetical protein